MTSATLDTSAQADGTSVLGKAVDALSRAAHVSHEARLFKSLATDAVEDGVHAAKRAFKVARRGIHNNAADLRDEAVYRVKREPLKTVGLAFGTGVLVGLVLGCAGRAGWAANARNR